MAILLRAPVKKLLEIVFPFFLIQRFQKEATVLHCFVASKMHAFWVWLCCPQFMSVKISAFLLSDAVEDVPDFCCC